MKKFFMFFMTVFACGFLSASDIWETLEETDTNGVISEKHTVISENSMKVTNISPNNHIETMIDLNADTITYISHKHKTYQVIKLSKYVEFAVQLGKDIMAQSAKFDADKALPKVTFEKQGTETVGKWNCEVWAVSLDGKPYSTVWLATGLKNQQVIDFKKKFTAVIPEALLKYRSVDAQIDDNFIDKGTIVKSFKFSQNKKMPTVITTVREFKKSDIKKLSLTIPANYVDKSTPETGQQQSQSQQQKK